MFEDSVRILANTCQGLGIDVALIADEGAKIPEGLEERISKKVTSLSSVQKQYNTLAATIEAVCAKANEYGLKVENLADLENEIPRLCRWADEGEKVLCAKRADAVSWFDKAKFSPDVEMSESSKRMRGRIEQSRDLDYLDDVIEEYRLIAEERFGNTQRSSIAEELPVENKADKEKPRDIVDSATKIFG